jgi:hypothetical protein
MRLACTRTQLPSLLTPDELNKLKRVMRLSKIYIRNIPEICMEKIVCFVFLVTLLAIGISGAEIPNLQGNWTGSWNGYGEENGYSYWANGSINLTIIDQKERIFSGDLTAKFQNETASSGFAGAIGLDNKTFYLAEFENGYALGTIISNDEIEYVYLADGKNGSLAIDVLHRTSK